MTTFIIGVLVFAASLSIEFCITRYIQCVNNHKRLTAVFWGLGQWAAGTFMFVVAVKLSLWYLPVEAAGIGLGTFWALRKPHTST